MTVHQVQIPNQEHAVGVRSPASPDAVGPSLRWLIGIISMLTTVRLAGLHLSAVDLFYDESQYWSWGHEPALGYFSKPPLLAWLLHSWTDVCGNSEWCVRAPSPVIYAFTSVIAYLIGQKLYGERTGFWAGLLTAFAPGLVFSARIASTDVPLLFFWSVALYAFLEFEQTRHKRWAAVMGAAVGLGLLSKYAMIYFVFGMALAWMMCPRVRPSLSSPAMGYALALAFVVVSPNLIWNFTNSFATFRHTSGLVLDEPYQPSLARASEFLLSQLAVMGPVIFPAAMFSSIRVRSPTLTDEDRLMIAFFVTPVAAATLFAIYSRAYANWASPSIVPAIVLGTAILIRQGRTFLLRGSVLFGLIIQIALLIGDAYATRLPPRIGNFINPYQRALGWRDYGNQAGRLASETGSQTIASDDRRSFVTLRYYLRDAPQKIVSWNRREEPPFDFGHGLTVSANEPILFVTTCADEERFRQFYSDVDYLGLYPDSSALGPRFHAYRLSGSISEHRELPPCGHR
jgi:4-amino-4-deoxy-L-arabinose transferase-like glycosyltransferase